jgi:hypothetical protein
MKVMKPVVVVALVFWSSVALAQSGGASVRGAATGDPAASTAPPGTSPTTGSTMKPTRSGSGTSASGGDDANGDHGLDKMPDSDKNVMPLDQQHKLPSGR